MKNQKKVLLIEDEKPLEKIVVDKFKNESFKTLVANNGVDGLEIALKEHPDLILLDVMMPKMDGITMLKKLRDDAWGKTAQVVMLTNLSDDKVLAEAKRLGSNDYFIKTNWKIEDVLTKVLEKLGE